MSFLLIFSVSFILLKTLNWLPKFGENIRFYLVDIILDLIYFGLIWVFNYYFIDGKVDIEVAGGVMFLELTVLLYLFFRYKKYIFSSKGVKMKWYYPLNDIFFFLVALSLAVLLSRWIV